jgi:hypothetical protein
MRLPVIKGLTLVLASAVACGDGTTGVANTALIITTVQIGASSRSILAGESVGLTATARNAAGGTVSNAAIAWSTSDAAVATVSNAGLVLGLSAGAVAITASASNAATPTPATAVESVFVAAVDKTITTVQVSAPSGSIFVDQSVTLTTVAKNAAGTLITDVSYTWTTSNASVATVTSAGVVTGVAPGTVSISAAATNAATSTPVSGSQSLDVQPVTLTSRVGHVMAFDEARNKLLLFGGIGAEGGLPRGDRGSTWTWDGSTWTRVATAGPAPRYLASMVYDAARQRVVLFGGQSGVFPNGTVLGDTWEWDGTAWAQKATTGPSARFHYTLAYDRVRQRVVVYGGFIPPNTQLRDIWEWNGTTWTQSSVSGADGIPVAAMYDEVGNVMAFYSTTSSGAVVMDTWNGTSLTRSATAGPGCALTQAELASAGAAGILYVGACGSTSGLSTWRWNGAAWASLGGTQPDYRINAAAAYDRTRSRLVLFGGAIDGVAPDRSDTWEFDGTTWVRKQ